MGDRRLQPGDTFEIDLAMRWADADMMQHLNNAMYFRYMEEARVMLMELAQVKQDPNHGFVVVHCACDYKRPITYPATIHVKLIADRIGRTSFDHRVEISVAGDEPGQVRATGRAVMVFVDQTTGQPCAWSEQALCRLGSVMAPAQQG